MMKRKSIVQGFLICAISVFIVLTHGCVGTTVRTYGGDKLPKSEVAVIKGFHSTVILPFVGLSEVGIEICYVDDGQLLEATKVEVLPGWHELVIRSYESPGDHSRFYRMSFNAEAGHKYEIRRRWDSLRKIVNITIVDVNTSATISEQSF
jgi:hypothetical protein